MNFACRNWLSTLISIFLTVSCVDDNNSGNGQKRNSVSPSELPWKNNVAVIADSIGRGAFARYDYGKPLEEGDSSTIFGFMLEAFVLKSPDEMNDKIDQSEFVSPEFAAYAGKGSVGLGFDSAVKQIGIEGGIYDGARLGAVVEDTPERIAVIDQKLGGVSLSEIGNVIFALGNNDFCDILDDPTNISLKIFRDQYLKQLANVEQHFPMADILIVSPVNVARVFEITEGATVEGVPLIRDCKTIQKRYCPGAFSDGVDIEQRAQLFFAEIQSIVTEYGQIFAQRYPATERRLRYADISESRFQTEHLAVDCFHPSVLGQQLLADEIKNRLKIITQ